MRAALWIALLACSSLRAASPVYVVLWFDTEDYVEPAADDAALRIATDLTKLGVRGTFKVVGEKARVLEQRGRQDVIRALALHDIGYHSNYHSMPPTPSLYLRDLGFLEGAQEFERREASGVRDLRRIFGTQPICYGQPGSSWGPQSYPALRRLGIPVYLDEGTQVGLEDQPFWYGGLLHIFNMGKFGMRAALDREPGDKVYAQFDKAAADLRARGGGVISSYYHPTEFVTTEFWDAVNFFKGADRERADWRRPHRRTEAESERCYAVLRDYVAHAKAGEGVRFVTAREMLQLYGSPLPPHVERARIAAHLAGKQTFLRTEQGALSAADMVQVLLGLEPEVIDGPATRIAGTYRGETIPRPAFERAKADAASFIKAHRRLPAEVWIGSDKLSIGEFAATLAGDDAAGAANVTVRKANLEFEKYFSNEPREAFSWPIHPEGFSAPELLELGKLEGWTLKPARLR